MPLPCGMHRQICAHSRRPRNNVRRGRCPHRPGGGQLQICTPFRRPRRIYQTSVGEGFYPSRRYNAANWRAPMRKRMRWGACVFDSASCAGGAEPLPYATGADSTDSHWCIPICRCLLHNPFVTASPCHLPLHKGGLVQCKRGGAVEICKKRAGHALPLRYDKSFTSSSLGSRLRSRTLRGSLFRVG